MAGAGNVKETQYKSDWVEKNALKSLKCTTCTCVIFVSSGCSCLIAGRVAGSQLRYVVYLVALSPSSLRPLASCPVKIPAPHHRVDWLQIRTNVSQVNDGDFAVST